jgi:hypothetical protein
MPLSLDGAEFVCVDVGPGTEGWSAYIAPALGPLNATVYLQFRYHEPGPIEVAELRVVVPPGNGFNSSVLRMIPVMRIEAAANQIAHRTRLAPVLGNATDPSASGHPALSPALLTPPERVPPPRPEPITLVIPDVYRKPDSFYRSVADAFLHLAALSSRPAHDLAEANAVPAATVHRWLREAKARGVLILPAHRGDG